MRVSGLQIIKLAIMLGLAAALVFALGTRFHARPDKGDFFDGDVNGVSSRISRGPGFFALQTTPWAGPSNTDDLSRWQNETREMILSRGGSRIAPEETDIVSFEVVHEKQLRTGVVQQFLLFTSWDGQEIPAYLHFPPGSGAAPGILVVPGHVRPQDSGIEQLANVDDSYHHAAARVLAEEGFVTLTPELRGFGYLGASVGAEHRIVAFNAVLRGTSYKWSALRDLGYATRLLRNLPRVAARPIGVSGASLGGELALQYAALDSSIAAVAFHSFSLREGLKSPIVGPEVRQPHYCHVLPGIDSVLPQEHWAWLLWPRPVLGVRGTDNKPFNDANRFVLGKPWNDSHREQLFTLRNEVGGHEFFVPPTVTFFREVLQ